jgi:hypothetical protein
LTIRRATPTDLPAIIALTEKRRAQYQAYQPTFWRPAPNAAQAQEAFFQTLFDRPDHLFLVHEAPEGVDGFLVARLVPSPPVYAPGGSTCSIDDFVAPWPIPGDTLLEAAITWAKEQGAAQVVVVTAEKDQAKRAMLAQCGLTIASEWWTKPI